MSHRDTGIVWSGFALTLTAALLQRMVPGFCVGWGISAGWRGEPGWAWWLAAAVAAGLTGTYLRRAAIGRTRHLTVEGDTAHD